MKILCCCAYGNARSHHCSQILKDVYHQDAVAIGLACAGDELRTLLFEWADLIIVLTDEVIGAVPAEYLAKTTLWDVGPDHYDYRISQSLMRAILEHLDRAPIDFGPEQVPWAQAWRDSAPEAPVTFAHPT